MTFTAAAIADQVRESRHSQTPLRIIGAGSWLHAGAPCVATARLEMHAHRGIVEYEPGDLTLTARAGTTLREIDQVTHAEGQWLTLDPAGREHATIGATVATASWGPLASAFGTPRDHILGCEFVTGAGDVVRAGGRVVKNVAGFDLVRLVTGAWGTLGAITEVTVRLRAKPEHEQTISVAIRDGGAGVARAWQWLRHGEFTPLAAELLSASLARRLEVGSDTTLLLRLGGNAAFLRAAEYSARALGETIDVPASCWHALSEGDPVPCTVIRLSTLPSQLSAMWARTAPAVESAGGTARATVGRGVIRCTVPRESQAASVLLSMLSNPVTLPGGASVTAIGEQMPAELWPSMTRRRSSDLLSTGVRKAFDPDGILNPGILGLPS